MEMGKPHWPVDRMFLGTLELPPHHLGNTMIYFFLGIVQYLPEEEMLNAGTFPENYWTTSRWHSWQENKYSVPGMVMFVYD